MNISRGIEGVTQHHSDINNAAQHLIFLMIMEMRKDKSP